MEGTGFTTRVTSQAEVFPEPDKLGMGVFPEFNPSFFVLNP